MATLKPYQVAAAALLGGFPASQVPTAVAVARGESSYNTGSENSCCTGLWQVHRTAHADKIARHGGLAKLKDPVVNATIAHEIWAAAGGWCTTGRVGQCNPWQAYGVSNLTGSWKTKLAEGAKAYAEVQRRQQAGETLQSMAGSGGVEGIDVPNPLAPLQGAMDAAGAIAGFAKAIVDFANRVGGWIADPQSWIRVAEVIGGTLLFGLGLRIAFNKQVMEIGGQVVRAVVPGGKVTKLATSAVKGK
ncbi:hypothetical protein ACQPZP_14620 [Spirillospora sp. CA-142024]|uniref:hypothetical protein n=1 Tax=Spirillospora sp. CA-142024 TaxID=3240036 RepID=UPI003D92A5CB